MVKGRNKTASKDYTQEQVCAATKDSYGIISRVAINLGCTWGTARRYIDMYPEAKALFSEEAERVLDVAETKVIQAINANDIQTAKWYLGMKGQERGYSDRREVDLSGKIEVSGVKAMTPAETEILIALLQGDGGSQ